jgi:hypothetical protein
MVKLEDACPVCGFRLGFSPWEGRSASHEICPSCGIQFGYDDMAGGDAERRKAVYRAWRAKWIERGMPWTSVGTQRPVAWDPAGQLRDLGIEADS